MVDELDPDLDAANQSQDTADAARFRADAATLSGEAAHDRTEADEFARMGLAAESGQAAKEAVTLDTRSADFAHRAELLDDALAHRKKGDEELAGVTEVHAEIDVAKAKGDRLTDRKLIGSGVDDVATTIRLTREAGAARGTEAALREQETIFQTSAEYDIETTAVEDERQAREGLTYRVAPKSGIVDPFAPVPTSSLAPTGAEEPVAMASDPGAEAEPSDV